MRQLIALLTAGFMMAMVGPVVAQDKAAKPSKLETRTVNGRVQSTTGTAIVVRGMEKDKEGDWAFSVDDKTTVRKGGQGASAATLKEGDRVTVNYTERDGKVVAQSVTVTDGASPSSSPPVRAPSPSK
jgi:Domain of unknown function (DUF5666)